MAPLLTYLAGLLYHGSPLVFPTYSQHTSPSQDPSTSTLGGLHLLLEGRGQVAVSLGVWGLKKDEIGQKIYSKEDINEVLTFFDVLPRSLRPEVCCGRWKARSTMINTVDHDSNSNSNPLLTTDLEDCDVIKGRRRDKEWHRVSEKDWGARLMLSNWRTCLRRQIDKNRTWQLCRLNKHQHLAIFWLVQDNNRTSPINRTRNFKC